MKDTEGQQIRTEQQIRVCELIYKMLTDAGTAG